MNKQSMKDRVAQLGAELRERREGNKGEGASEPEDAAPKTAAPAKTRTAVLPPPPSSPAYEVRELPLDVVCDSPYQPRTRPIGKREVEELMHSISANGQITPIIVEPADGADAGRYFVHSGHRRCAALRFLGAENVKAIVREDLDERSARKLALADNLGREDLTIFEQAMALRTYCETFDLQVEAAGQELGLKRSTAYRLNSVLSASEALIEFFKDSRMSARAAELVAKLEARRPKRAFALARKYIEGHATLKTLEDELKKSAPQACRKAAARKDVELKATRNGVTLRVELYRNNGASESQRQRIIDAVSQLLARLGIDAVQAATDEEQLG